MIKDPTIGDLVRSKETGEFLGLVTDINIWGYKKHYEILCCDGTNLSKVRDYLLEKVNG
tara:strand:- start:219 stop:395 length:177 start_codon:yes stop_codon:yes gene_type:complete